MKCPVCGQPMKTRNEKIVTKGAYNWFCENPNCSVIRLSINPRTYARKIIADSAMTTANVAEFIMSRHDIEGGLNELTIQYRMHEEICNAVNRLRRELSRRLYLESRPLKPANEVRYRTLESPPFGYDWRGENIRPGQCLDREILREVLDPSRTFVVINTDRIPNVRDEERTLSNSVRNVAEARAVVDIAIATYESYSRMGENLSSTIISPYSAQVNEIMRELQERARVPNLSNEDRVITAYRSQGREYPFVILSLVRRNLDRKIGFLEDEVLRAQVYVACSRAQAKLVILMSRETFGEKPLYDSLISVGGSRNVLLWEWD
jgi:superfamily I DNA and/or RNA helicase